MKSLIEYIKENLPLNTYEDKLEYFGEEDNELKVAVYNALEQIANKFTRKYHIDKGDMQNAIEWFMTSYYDK